MNHRPRPFLPLLISIPLALAGCTSYYKNVEACKDKMRTAYPDAATAPLKITGSNAGYHGSRVIVHATIDYPPRPPATKRLSGAAAAECTFSEQAMTGFQWLLPANLAPKPPSADADADE
ncbi:hypothetical protein AWB71_00914 [Caballeronia peredens]|nr:hypothetical protein AWB71_00914 [Caballeronia peredens]